MRRLRTSWVRGKESDGNRWNDCHYTNKAKQQARKAAKEEGKR